VIVRLLVAFLVAALAYLATASTQEPSSGTITVTACVREAPQPQPDDHAVLRAPGAGVASSTIRWAALASSSVVPLPSVVHGARRHQPATHASAIPHFRRFPLLI
jgi:hypothetical protein